ncbi:DUF1292 domain-containing protein [Paenibacillus sp. YN15]|uniref:DUF1292 domain-containing protein n=1 Tax=Paenibacillus sp. YN15 TaxID=1742774 RepID=UPI000DCBFF19|nr:DUF1292 domain-containing protein [Paenibacillus sp. YN15]RAU96351.1 DUF1292 domain-containing protein [Paenibacillus sp. YN15]
MKTPSLDDVKPLSILKEVFGEEVLLEDETGASEAQRILAEFEVDGVRYAVLQSHRMKREDETALYHIVTDEQGELQLAEVPDDDEWETILELYDEMTVSFDE